MLFKELDKFLFFQKHGHIVPYPRKYELGITLEHPESRARIVKEKSRYGGTFNINEDARVVAYDTHRNEVRVL